MVTTSRVVSVSLSSFYITKEAHERLRNFLSICRLLSLFFSPGFPSTFEYAGFTGNLYRLVDDDIGFHGSIHAR